MTLRIAVQAVATEIAVALSREKNRYASKFSEALQNLGENQVDRIVVGRVEF
jgi:hypothetical protein